MKIYLQLFVGFLYVSVSVAQNPKCCVCFDGCKSTITKPDVLIQLNSPFLPDRVTCEEIRRGAEDQLLIPDLFCPLFDRQDFRVAW